jgi:Sigma-70, region 4
MAHVCTDRCSSDFGCVLALVAVRGAFTLDEIGVIFSLTRERIRQIEVKALRKLRLRGLTKTFRQRPHLQGYADHEPRGPEDLWQYEG